MTIGPTNAGAGMDAIERPVPDREVRGVGSRATLR